MRYLMLLPCLALAVSACQSYEPLPLDPDAHLQSWRARDPAGTEVVEFAKRLAERDTASRPKYDPSDGLSLPEAEVVALFFNPELRVARLEAEASLAGAREAGAWEDPDFEVDGAWIIESIANPFIIGAGIGFTIPLSGRPGVEQDLAFAEHGVSRRLVVALEWEVLTALHVKWRELASLDEMVRLNRQLVEEIGTVKVTADALKSAGELSSLDARVFEIELATLRGELLNLRSGRREAVLEIHELLGLTPSAPVRLLPSLADSRTLTKEIQKRAIVGNPLLAARRAEYQVAEQSLRLEIRKQYPDLHIGPGYELEEGQSRISLGFGIPIPIINLNRQGIAEARGARLAAKAAFEGALEKLVHALARVEARRKRVEENRRYIEETLAPLVDRQLADAVVLAGLGEFDALLQLDALTRRHEARLQVLDAHLQLALARDETFALLGPTFKEYEPEEGDDD